MDARPNKLLCFISDLDGGGAQRTMVNLANSLNSLPEWHVRLVVAEKRGPGIAWLDPSLDVVDLACPRVRYAVFPLRQAIRIFQPDIIFSTMLDNNIIAALARFLSGHRCALVLRETNSQRARGDLSKIRRMLAGWAYRQADISIALSSGVAEEMLEDCRLQPDRLITLPNPVDIAHIRQRLTKSTITAKKSKMAGPHFIAAGRLTRQKGFDHLLSAFASMKHPGRLSILGDGKDRGALENQAKLLGIAERVEFAGFVCDPYSRMAAADCFVLSSRWEGFGHVIVEAMACDLPVIAMDCPHGPRDIIDHEKDGLLVPAGDIAQLTNAMDRIAADPVLAERLAGNALGKAETFRKEIVSQRYGAYLKAACSKKRGQ